MMKAPNSWPVPLPRMRVLVTGGLGFVGCHLVQYLLQHAVRLGVESIDIYDDLSNCRDDKLDWFDQGNTMLRHFKRPEDVCGRDYDLIYHLAATVGVRRVCEAKLGVLTRDLDATLWVCNWARRCNARVVFASSAEVYGTRSGTLFESDPMCWSDYDRIPYSRRWYAVSKLFGEMHLQRYARNLIIPRFFSLAGEGQSFGAGNVIPDFVDAALNFRDLQVHFQDARRQFFDVKYVAALLGEMAQRHVFREIVEKVGQIINVGRGGSPTRIDDLASMVLEQSRAVWPNRPDNSHLKVRRRDDVSPDPRNVMQRREGNFFWLAEVEKIIWREIKPPAERTLEQLIRAVMRDWFAWHGLEQPTQLRESAHDESILTSR